jgi:hypothetical protein
MVIDQWPAAAGEGRNGPSVAPACPRERQAEAVPDHDAQAGGGALHQGERAEQAALLRILSRHTARGHTTLYPRTRTQAPYARQWMFFAEAGCLIGYGEDEIEWTRQMAGIVHKILMGAKPADIPIEQPTKLKLVINLKTAKALGLTIPQSLLLRADQVIE